MRCQGSIPELLSLENRSVTHACSSVWVLLATLQPNTSLFQLLALTLPQLADVCINSSHMKCQLRSIFVKYMSRALYLTHCDFMAVECEISFLKMLLSFAFSVNCLSPRGLLLPATQALVLFYALVMFCVFHLKSKA